MKKIILLFLSGIFFAASGDVFASNSFTPFTDDFVEVAGTKVEIDDMPSLDSQDSLGICYASVAATILNYENCRLNNKRTGKVVKCSTVPDEEKFSSLGLTRYGNDPEGKEIYSASYPALRINGGSSWNVIARAGYFVGSGPSEKCISLDKVLSKIGGVDGKEAAQLAFWKDLQALFQKSQGQTAELSVKKYGSQVQKCMGMEVSNEALLHAFGEKTYQKFLRKLMIGKECNRANMNAYFEGQDSTIPKQFPEENKKSNYKATIKKIQNVLNDKHPLALQNICLDEVPKPIYQGVTASQGDIPDGFCKNPHATVISGYKRVCAGKECYDAIKVVNSWGEGFQKKINDGWVKADFLLDRTNYESGTLAWIEDLPPK